MLALIKSNPILGRVDVLGVYADGGWVDLPDGSRVSPAYDGWALRGYELRTIQPAAEIPEGYRLISSSVEMVEGVPAVVNVTEPDGGFLDRVKRDTKADIDEAAERARLKYITPGAGQAMTYAEKAAQARQCLAAADPQEADYPLLAAEIGITAASLVDVAAVVVAAHSAWIEIGAAIEGIRLQAKAAVDVAEDAAAVHAAADVGWP